MTILVSSVFVVIVGFIGVSLGFGETSSADHSPEGFSSSSEGLPSQSRDAWRATVLLENRPTSWPDDRNSRVRTRRGSGVVMEVTEDRRTAMVVTNAHLVDGNMQRPDVRVGFSRSRTAEDQVWTGATRVVSVDSSKDLAFLEVGIPHGADPAVARFAEADCLASDGSVVVTIGWPDLSVRKMWGVDPPANHRDHVKRFSVGWFLTWLEGYRRRPQVRRLMEKMQVVFHNADVLPGSSGGPLVNSVGEVIGINAVVIGNSDTSDHNRFCARADPHDPTGCVHLAIASAEVVREYERVLSSTIALGECTLEDREHMSFGFAAIR